MHRLRNAVESKRVLPGGGVWQLACASWLRRCAETLQLAAATDDTATDDTSYAAPLDVYKPFVMTAMADCLEVRWCSHVDWARRYVY